MPDDLDYEALGRLLAHPDRWSDDDLANVRFMIGVQRSAIAEAHPKDERSRASYARVLEELEAALLAHLESRR